MLAADHLLLSHFSILDSSLIQIRRKEEGNFLSAAQKFYLHANVNQLFGGFVRVAQILFQFRLIRSLRCTFDVYACKRKSLFLPKVG